MLENDCLIESVILDSVFLKVDQQARTKPQMHSAPGGTDAPPGAGSADGFLEEHGPFDLILVPTQRARHRLLNVLPEVLHTGL